MCVCGVTSVYSGICEVITLQLQDVYGVHPVTDLGYCISPR